MTTIINGTTFTAKKHNLDYNNDGVTMFEIGTCECDDEENVISWIPSYLIEDFKKGEKNAKEAIEDYMAGWISVL